MSRLETLETGFQENVKALLLRLLQETGYEWLVVQGRRTIAEQDALYAQGRTTPGKVVTRAHGGQSAHNFGLAADIVPMKDNDAWWDAPKELWKEMADIAKDMGLVPGFYFTTIYDPDHVEDPNWRVAQAKWRSGELHVA